MERLRTLAGIVVAGLLAWLAVALLTDAPEVAEARAFTSSEQCRECHPAVFEEWEGSAHANAWINPDVRALSNDFANTDCIDCHAPRPVFETGIGERVLPRAARRSEGVDCLACHQLPEGGVAATFTDPKVACRPVARRELQRADFCAGCHDQHQTVQQWSATSFATEGVSCVDCHMPWRDGDPEAGRSHVFPGGHDIEYVRSAVAMRGGPAEEGGWIVEVENVAAGHHFPTDERSRAADLFWRPLGPDGEGAGDWRFLYRFRDPYRHEVDLTSTLLPFGDTRRVSLDHPDATGGAEVILVYRRSPYYSHPETGAPIEVAEVVDPQKDRAELLHRIVLGGR